MLSCDDLVMSFWLYPQTDTLGLKYWRLFGQTDTTVHRDYVYLMSSNRTKPGCGLL